LPAFRSGILVSLLILTLFGNGISELVWATALPQIIPVAYVVRGAMSSSKRHDNASNMRRVFRASKSTYHVATSPSSLVEYPIGIQHEYNALLSDDV
jgi:hypothetical protein